MLTLNPLDFSTITWDMVKARAREIAKEGNILEGESGSAVRVRSYDDKGRLIASANISELDPSDWRSGTRFEVDVKLPHLVKVFPPGASKPDLTPIAADIVTPPTPKKRAVPALPIRQHVTPARLHDKHWTLKRLLAPFCFDAARGIWINPLDPDTFNQAGQIESFCLDFDALLASLQSIVPSALGEVS